jgi:signal transduction histidine kinase
MRIPTLFRTSVFQLTLVYMALFAASVIALFAFAYWSTVGYLERQTNAVIDAEIQGLYEQYERLGLAGLADVINERVRGDDERRSVYILADPIGRALAGNVQSWPRELDNPGEWVDFTKREEATGLTTPVRARVLRIHPGFWLLVGRDIRELEEITAVFRSTSLYGLTLTLGLALIGGLVMGVSAQRRLAALNRTTRKIIAGDLTQRAPITGSNDEHDELAGNVNAMLDQIENLLAEMRHVGDAVAHDLRGPLTRLRNRLETVAATEHPSREDVVDCVEQVERVIDTFNALLRIARVESGAYRSAFAPVDLDKIVRDVCDLYQAIAHERSILLSCSSDPAIQVFGDRELLAQALTNILDNALKYTPHGGSVSVVLRRSEDTASITVADSGPGIPVADRQRVLQRFTRLDQARSHAGNGLGLALVNAVVSQHHGKLTLDDNTPGLVVALELPAMIRSAAPTAPKLAAAT